MSSELEVKCIRGEDKVPGVGRAFVTSIGVPPRSSGVSKSELQIRQLHPAANLLRKHWKSLAFRVGGLVEWSQLA